MAVANRFREIRGSPGELAVVDWTTPTQPRTVYSDEAPNLAIGTWDVKVAGDVAGLASTAPGVGGVDFFDASDPENPEHVSFYDVSTADRYNGRVHNFFIDGEYAYVGVNAATTIDSDGDGVSEKVRQFGEDGVDIVDVSDPTTPTRVSTWQLKEFPGPAFATASVNGFHDLYVQDGLAYVCFWDAGIVVLDVSDPSAPELAGHFGEAPDADKEVRFRNTDEESRGAYFQETGVRDHRQRLPGNAHYVQPSPDGTYVFVGAESFIKGEPGGIDIWDVSDLGDISDIEDLLAGPKRVGHISPPDIELSKADQEFVDTIQRFNVFNSRARALVHTSHNFDVTDDRLYTSWHGGGVRVFDITDPSAPTEIGVYDPEDASFWAAVAAGETIVASDIGTGLVFLEAP
ncbi:LVIVD repeat-containing protein [Halorussus salinisoli]|uniref:LVIVD repeat-containing protein n=1 Tax=Halorussus salinisoli TaxID=2558242 RepID=UPI001485284E|nr:hypothetical protein [Halorussus salinisoli]